MPCPVWPHLLRSRGRVWPGAIHPLPALTGTHSPRSNAFALVRRATERMSKFRQLGVDSLPDLE
jgi:hypothetical protein